MTDYGRLNDIQGIDALLKRLVSVSSEKAVSLREQHPGLPEDYVEFLLRIGARGVEVDTQDPTAVDVAPDFATFIAQKFSEIASWQ
jgi:hypothetical protein